MDHEVNVDQRKQQRLIRQAKKLLADLRDMDYRTERDVDRSTIAKHCATGLNARKTC